MSKLNKIIAVGTAIATTAWMTGAAFVPIASAVTADEIQAQIDALMETLAGLTEQLAELEGDTPSASYEGIPDGFEFTEFMKRGSKSDEVKYLQIVLQTEVGEDMVGTADGIFGGMTDASVKQFQGDNDLTADGLVGAKSREVLNEKLDAGTTPECTTDSDCDSGELCSADGACITEEGCECTDWVDDVCSDGKMNQTRTCDPSACAAETQAVEDDDCVVSGDGLTVSLASDTPATAIVPLSAANVAFLKFNLTASSDGNSNVSQIVILRDGVGASGDFTNLYLYEGDTRLTSGRTISSESEKATFSNLSLAIPAGETRALTVIAEMNSTGTGDAHVLSVSEITADVTVNGLPIIGNVMTVGAQTAGTLTIATSGSIPDPYVGANETEVSRFKLTAGSGENVDFMRIILTNGGSIASSDMSNFKLYQSGDLLAETSTMNGDQITIVLDEVFEIKKGQNRTFNVYADVAGRPDQTIKFYVDYDTDIYGVGQKYGSGVGITATAFEAADITASNNLLTLKGGKVTTTVNGPSAGKIGTTVDDIVMLNYSMTATQDVEVRSTKLYICWDDTGNGYGDDIVIATHMDEITDIKIVNADTGDAVTGPTDGSGFTLEASAAACGSTGLGAYKVWTDYYDINEGEARDFQVTLDLAASDIAATDKIKVVLDDFADSTDIKSRITNDYIATTDIVPSTNISGNSMTVQAAALTMALSSTPVTQTYIKGAEAKEMLGILFTAGDASDIEVSSIKVTAYVDDTTSGVFIKDTDATITAQNLVDNLYLYNDNTAIAGPLSVDADGEMSFTNFSWIVPAGATEKLVLKGDISTNAPENGTSDRIKFDIAAAADVTCYDDNSSSVDATGHTFNSTTSDAGTRITISSAGSLYLAADADTPLSDIIIMGDTNVPVAKYKFTAVNEGFTVTQIRLDNAATDMPGDAVTAGDYDDSIATVKITYTEEGGDEVTKTGYLTSGYVDFNDLTMYVPKDDDAVMTVKVDVNTKESGADTGDQPKLSLSVDATNDDEFEAISDAGTTIDDDDLYLDGTQTSSGDDTVDSINQFVIRKTKPTFTLDSAVSNNLVNGVNTLIKFTVSADANEDVALKLLSFDISVNDVATSTALTLSSPAIYRSTDLTSSLTAVIEDGSNATSWTDGSGQSMYVMFGSATSGEEVVPAGTSRTYYLKGSVADAHQSTSGDDSITISLKSADTTTANKAITGGLDTSVGSTTLAEVDNATISPTCYYVWSDNSEGVNHASTDQTTYKDWTNGYLVDVLPSDSVNLER